LSPLGGAGAAGFRFGLGSVAIIKSSGGPAHQRSGMGWVHHCSVEQRAESDRSHGARLHQSCHFVGIY
jgi:hypothetical protein